MGWRKSSVVEERLRFVVLADRGECSLTRLCAEFGISRQTGYTWLKRYRAEGAVGMNDRSRRPRSSPGQTASIKEDAVVELRTRYPDWGAAKLARILRNQQRSIELNTRTVHRILDRRGLIPDEDRRKPALKRFERSSPNELWQMDFKGPQGFNKGSPVGPLSVMDDHSRYLLLLRHLGSTQVRGVQSSLTETFQHCGMPEAMLMDHGIPWWNGNSPWGLTELSVWIMQLGIRLVYSGICHPQTQGKVERMHGALQRAVRRRKTDPENQEWLNVFREEYNHFRPHEALSMATPGSVWKPSEKVFPEQLKEWEYSPGTPCFRLGEHGRFRWCGRRWEVSGALRRQLVGVEQLGDRAIVYFCRTPIRELDLANGTATPIIGMPIRSLQD